MPAYIVHILIQPTKTIGGLLQFIFYLIFMLLTLIFIVTENSQSQKELNKKNF